ncbi:MAG: F0F1 ATP synthase subunit delta [Alphaproteobacteria bacterium]|tara:strand:- start:359 stop:916 length:558 start_codon:yes stop_codon:yes gene_type:complete
MASQLSSGDLISDRYASALYDLASEKKLVDAVLDDLLFIQSMIKNNKDLKLVVKSPLIKSNDKLVILQNILKSKKPNELSSTFLKVLSKNKRFQKILDIISQFKKINAQKRGDVLADITSAEKLSNEQQDNIKEQLRTILGDKLSLNYKVDEQIIGGLIIKVGSKMIDTSLSNKINKLKIAMKGA